MKSSIGLALVVLAALLGVQSQAAAFEVKLPPPVLPAASGEVLLGICAYGGTCIPGGANVPPAGTTTLSSGVAKGSGTEVLLPYPTISGALLGTNGSFVDVTLSYEFEVFDPYAPVGFTAPVSVTFSTKGAVAGKSLDDDYVSLQVGPAYTNRNTIPTLPVFAGTPPSGASATSFNVSDDLTGLSSLYSNTPYSVSMEVYLASGAAPNSNGAKQTGYIDPTITIDPGELDSAGLNEFDLVLSPGVGATPLPSTWTMLIAGLVGLGFFSYRGSKKNSAALAAA